ncbi:MAG: transcriptional regulator [Saprospiraceae bacterium]|nr:transcriptional regulator [Saprospiraceae bacterium]
MRLNVNIFEITKAFALTISLLYGAHAHLSAKADPVVDQYWADFCRNHPKYDQKALEAFFQGLSEFKPAFTGERLGYAVSLVILWAETLDRPADQAAVYYHCGVFAEMHLSVFPPYLVAFYYERTVSLSERHQLYDLLSDALAKLVEYYFKVGPYEKTVIASLSLEKLLNEPPMRAQLTRIGYKYYVLGQNYYRLRKYGATLDYYAKALESGDFKADLSMALSLMNTMGLCYHLSGELEKALIEFDKVIEVAQRANILGTASLAKGNKGNVLLEMGRFEEAEPLLLDDFYTNLHTSDSGSSIGAGVLLVRSYLAHNQLEKARHFLSIIESVMDTTKVNPKALALQSEYYSRINNWERAYHYAHRLQEVKDSIEDLQPWEGFYDARERYALLLQESLWKKSLEDQEATLRSRKIHTWLISGAGAVLLTCAALFLYYLQRRRLLEHKFLLRKSEGDREELAKRVRQMHRQLQLVEDLEKQVLNAPSRINEEEIRAILSQFTFSTEEDWSQFKKIVDEIHRDFIEQLRRHPANFSAGEVRLLTLLKLEFSSREIARMLGINMESVKKNKQRLRKKLNEAGDTELILLLIRA